MAKCPKCGKKLTFLNVSQFCPECGVNMRYYNFEENFIEEAKYAELSNASVHVKIKRLKASFIGSKLTIFRLIACLLPIVGLLIPAASFTIDLPFKSNDLQISGLGIYSMFSGGDLNFIMGSKGDFSPFNALFTALIGYVAIALMAVFVLLLTILCFISYKNMQKIICVFDIFGVAACIADAVLVSKFVCACTGYIISAKSGFGLYVTIALFLVDFAVNLILAIKGIPVEYGEGMVERNEIYQKLKKGEVKLSDLPQPVVETEETRKIDEEIRKEEEKLAKQLASSEEKDTEEGEPDEEKED